MVALFLMWNPLLVSYLLCVPLLSYQQNPALFRAAMGPLTNSISQVMLQLKVARGLREVRSPGAGSPFPPPFAWSAAVICTGAAAISSPGEESRT